MIGEAVFACNIIDLGVFTVGELGSIKRNEGEMYEKGYNICSIFTTGI